MNKRQRRVFTLLRTKTKAIGLNRKELESLAIKIDKNLELEEDASDEDVDAAAEAAIDAALPFLEVSQSVAQRSIQTALQRRQTQQDDDDDDVIDDDDVNDDDDPDDVNRQNQRQPKGKGKKNRSTKSEDSELLKILKKQNESIEALQKTIAGMQGDRVNETRRARLKKLVENTGTFGKAALRQFDLMTFKDDDAFDDYLDEVQKDLDDLNQERANEGLGKLGDVPGGGGKKNPETQNKPEVMSDEAIIAMAGGTPQTTK